MYVCVCLAINVKRIELKSVSIRQPFFLKRAGTQRLNACWLQEYLTNTYIEPDTLHLVVVSITDMERVFRTVQHHLAGLFTSSGRARFSKDHGAESWGKKQKGATRDVWEHIFKNDDWVRAVVSQELWPVLVGHQLGAMGKHSRHGVYMALAVVRLGIGIAGGETCPKLLAMSLRSEISMESLEVNASTFTLNVSAIMEESAEIEVSDWGLVVSKRDKGSTCLVYFPDDAWGLEVVMIPVDIEARPIVIGIDENNKWSLPHPNSRRQEIRGKMGCSIAELRRKTESHLKADIESRGAFFQGAIRGT